MGNRTKAIKYEANDGKVFLYDAIEKLDIDKINRWCDKIDEHAAEGCKKINNKIKNVKIGKDTLAVADSSLEPALLEVGEYIKSIASSGVAKITAGVKEEALSAFNELQTSENKRAENDRDNYNNSLAKKDDNN